MIDRLRPTLGKIRFVKFQSLELVVLGTVLLAGTSRAEIPDVELSEFTRGLAAPVWISPVDSEASHYYVIEQSGIIRDVSARGEKGDVVMDIKDRVNYGGEKGLLGLALHPNFAKNHRLFVNYTTGEDAKGKPRTLITRISELKASDDFKTVDPASEIEILQYNQPYSNHNGGQIAFGPDGYLYNGAGDGGAGNDPQGNGQKMDTLLGKFIRIDVDRPQEWKNYSIPRDNPFVGQTNARPEIFAFGLRNPWRWSFDRKTGSLWAGDVGQNKWEEVDVIEKGRNYGWRIMEAFHCTPSVSPDNCDQTGLTLPIVEYPRTGGDSKDLIGNSITGGYVYRGTKNPSLAGLYIYGDYTSRRIWALRYEDGKVKENRQVGTASQTISSFGEDADGELFVVGHGGIIWRLNQK